MQKQFFEFFSEENFHFKFLGLWQKNYTCSWQKVPETLKFCVMFSIFLLLSNFFHLTKYSFQVSGTFCHEQIYIFCQSPRNMKWKFCWTKKKKIRFFFQTFRNIAHLLGKKSFGHFLDLQSACRSLEHKKRGFKVDKIFYLRIFFLGLQISPQKSIFYM